MFNISLSIIISYGNGFINHRGNLEELNYLGAAYPWRYQASSFILNSQVPNNFIITINWTCMNKVEESSLGPLYLCHKGQSSSVTSQTTPENRTVAHADLNSCSLIIVLIGNILLIN